MHLARGQYQSEFHPTSLKAKSDPAILVSWLPACATLLQNQFDYIVLIMFVNVNKSFYVNLRRVVFTIIQSQPLWLIICIDGAGHGHIFPRVQLGWMKP